MSNFIPQNFNDLLALVVVILVFAFVLTGSMMIWDNKVADLATGVFLAKFSDVAQYYFRKAKDEKPEGK